MYEKFYGLKEKPFSLIADPSFLYLSKKHELALNYLEYGLSEQVGFIVITGEVGSGKTTLIRYLIYKLEKSPIKIAMLFNTNITPKEFLEIILREWHLRCDGKDKADVYETLNNFLLQEYIRKNKVVLIIDEAQNLPQDTLEEIRMLSNLNDEKQPILNIILLGQPNLRDRLNQSALEQLRQRILVHYHLESLDYEDSVQYVKHRLQKAGSNNLEIFTPDALEGIFKYSKGVPRVINIICDTALVYGFAEGIEIIDESIIKNVIEDRIEGGLIFIDDSITAPEPSHNSEGTELLKEFQKIRQQYDAFTEHIKELTLVVNKLHSARESAKKTDGNGFIKQKKAYPSEYKRDRHNRNKKINIEINNLLERMKCVEKNFRKTNSNNNRLMFRFISKKFGKLLYTQKKFN